jgi:hypothetical protein
LIASRRGYVEGIFFTSNWLKFSRWLQHSSNDKPIPCHLSVSASDTLKHGCDA